MKSKFNELIAFVQSLSFTPEKADSLPRILVAFDDNLDEQPSEELVMVVLKRSEVEHLKNTFKHVISKLHEEHAYLRGMHKASFDGADPDSADGKMYFENLNLARNYLRDNKKQRNRLSSIQKALKQAVTF